jgi:hypothetical protein
MMNDFTKEELEILMYGLGNINDKPCMELENKLQSMIDNYCAHEWQNSGDHGILSCINCDSQNVE